MQKIQFGVTAKDRISGFKGVVTGFSNYITGCASYLVQPPVKADGDFVESRWVDEDRLVVEDAPIVELKVETNGADKPAPRR